MIENLSHSSRRTSAILKYFCPLINLKMLKTSHKNCWPNIFLIYDIGGPATYDSCIEKAVFVPFSTLQLSSIYNAGSQRDIFCFSGLPRFGGQQLCQLHGNRINCG